MSKEEIVEELIKWFENYGVMIPDGSSATIKDFMYYSEIQSMAEELYEDFFADLQSQLAITEKALELAVDDKCFAENCIAESFIGKGAKIRVPKKEQWYLEKAKEMLEND